MSQFSYDRFVEESISVKSGLPGARMFWGSGRPEPPYFTYTVVPGSVLFVDNDAGFRSKEYEVSLYQGDEYDEDLEARFERVLGEIGTYSLQDSYMNDDDLFVTVWHLNVTGRLPK